MEGGLENLFAIIMGAGAIQGIFMAVVLYRHKPDRDASDLTLSILMLVFTANILHAGFLRDIRFASPVPASFEPFQIFFGPLVYLYVQFKISPTILQKKPISRILPHLLPACAFTVALPFLFPRFSVAFPSIVNSATWALSIAYLLYYIVLTTRNVHKFRDRLKNVSSAIERADLGWVQMFMIVFLAIEALYFALFAWMVHGNPFPHFGKILALATTLLTYGLGFRGYVQGIHVQKNIDETSQENIAAMGAEKYRRSGLDEKSVTNLGTSITEFMESKKPWLDCEFSLQDLADGLNRPRNQVSQAINESCGMNFYDFVNGYRVAEVQRLISLPENSSYKMIALAFDSGFASKPTFNAAFKKKVGCTPSEYRSEQRGTNG